MKVFMYSLYLFIYYFVCYTGGQLLEVVTNNHLTPRQVLRVFYETCSAVAHMHNQIPPIIHRDLKVSVYMLKPPH